MKLSFGVVYAALMSLSKFVHDKIALIQYVLSKKLKQYLQTKVNTEARVCSKLC